MKTIKTYAEAITPADINAVLTAPRNREIDEKKNRVGKVSAKDLVIVRGVIGDIFLGNGLNDEYKTAIASNNLLNEDIAAEKFGKGAYDAEFKRLHKAVQDAFKNAGRNDLADQFGITVPVYTSAFHPVDFIATLLKGPNNKITKASTESEYGVLNPFKKVMQDTLIAKGIAAPNDIDVLTQLFYNTFVAKEEGNEPLNFDTITPGDMYHADDAVIAATIAYIKTLADKKQAGEVLPVYQDKIATAGLQIQNELTNVATKEVENKIGAVVLDKGMLIGLAVLAVIVIFFFVKK